MKAVRCTKYGSPDTLIVEEIPKPVPKPNQILIRIHASTVTMGDCELRNLTLPPWTRIPMRIYMGWNRPKKYYPGMELSGVVESIGNEVTGFEVGDEVFGGSGMKMGTNSDYICLSEHAPIVKKPKEVKHEEVVTLPVGGINALHFLRKAQLKPGQSVLINGAGGSIGTYAVQLAKFMGAEVTAVDRTDKLDMLKKIGADHVLDYTKEHFVASGKKYDVILDVTYSSSFKAMIRSLNSPGYYLMANPMPGKMIRGTWVSKTTARRVVFQFAAENKQDLSYLANLIRTGKLCPVIDKRYPQRDIRKAHEYVEGGHKRGHVIIENSG